MHNKYLPAIVLIAILSIVVLLVAFRNEPVAGSPGVVTGEAVSYGTGGSWHYSTPGFKVKLESGLMIHVPYVGKLPKIYKGDISIKIYKGAFTGKHIYLVNEAATQQMHNKARNPTALPPVR
jgi:hypothetical protein